MGATLLADREKCSLPLCNTEENVDKQIAHVRGAVRTPGRRTGLGLAALRCAKDTPTARRWHAVCPATVATRPLQGRLCRQ